MDRRPSNGKDVFRKFRNPIIRTRNARPSFRESGLSRRKSQSNHASILLVQQEIGLFETLTKKNTTKIKSKLPMTLTNHLNNRSVVMKMGENMTE